MPQVADLWAALGLRVNKREWAEGDKSISTMKTALGALGAYFGGKFLYDKLITFNSGVEDTKNKIAGLLALTNKTSLTTELANADSLFANLQRRSASLPGTTQEYTNMLGMLVGPLSKAGLGLQDIEDLTVNSVVAAKAFGIQWEVAARDVQQLLQGQVTAGENQLAQMLGIDTAEARRKHNARTNAQRAADVKALLTQKQLTQLAEAQGATFSGMMATLEDAFQQFMATVGKPLFTELTKSIKEATEWLAKNREQVTATAKAIGSRLVDAFHAVRDAISFIVDHWEGTKAVLVGIGIVAVGVLTGMAAAAIIAYAPFIALVAAITGIYYALTHWDETWEAVGEIVDTVVEGWKDIFEGFSDWMGSLPGKFVDAWVRVGDAIKNALSSAYDWIVNKASEAADAIWSAIKDIPVLGRIASAAESLASPIDVNSMLAQAQGIPVEGGAVPANLTASVSMTVNPSKGMDEQALAQLAADKSIEAQVRMLQQAHDALSGGRR